MTEQITREQIEAAEGRRKQTGPAWYERPTGPGLWVLKYERGAMIVERVTEFSCTDWHNRMGDPPAVYGPIPEMPEDVR